MPSESGIGQRVEQGEAGGAVGAVEAVGVVGGVGRAGRAGVAVETYPGEALTSTDNYDKHFFMLLEQTKRAACRAG